MQSTMGRLNSPISLTVDHQTTGFDCGIDSLNEWLIRRALKNEYGGGSRTYVVCAGNQVVGYYAIAAGSIAREDASGRIRRNMPDPCADSGPPGCKEGLSRGRHWSRAA